MDKLLLDSNGSAMEVQTKVFRDASVLKPLLNKDCMKVFARLQEKASYPAELASFLGINEQKVYYYIKQLRNSGLISVEKTEDRNGATAKYYSANFDSFAIIPNESILKGRSKIFNKEKGESEASEFLKEFTKNGVFNAKIVVGSPDPHGPHKARARDGHLAAELAAFLGANCSGFQLPLVFLDTMVNDLKHENSNLIILGGPVTNKLAEQVNEFLPIKFSEGSWALTSSASGKEYIEDSIGVIEKISHPHFKGKWILMVAGKRNAGTIAAIIALSKKTSETVKPNSKDSKIFAHVVEGMDMNGDGLIDEVEFRE